MIAAALEAGECRVWWADPRERALGTLTATLSGSELERARRFHQERDRRRFLTGSWLLRRVAAAQLGLRPEDVQVDRRCPDCPKPHGKPHIRNDGQERLHVSVSHSTNLVAVAMTTVGPLGVDVEALPADSADSADSVDEVAQCALSPTERSALRALRESERRAAFARLWVRKEAALKATGHGLRIPPDQVEVGGPDDAPAVLRWPLDVPPDAVRLHVLDPGEGYVGVVAVLAGDRPVTVFESRVGDLREIPVPLTPVAA
ncbi:4'-phosphopantetheinyl transferase family protein [Sphaerimonospora thailandensis]|uniref:4'-phosphopantetheinyl transferase n=1 Tax=Sphaerimonospora thailandensis TaxID=795644 RepID=A0A8J3VXD1_9ACTN|nr:4'-phosphopantetheinyl transferase superfamily protein [Sphaerimonospora thailandensis]GIH67775.1 hypothetical protein Mth01_00280 [Sphaerimonospora thailandensis]